jgi:hypothetical protein
MDYLSIDKCHELSSRGCGPLVGLGGPRSTVDQAERWWHCSPKMSAWSLRGSGARRSYRGEKEEVRAFVTDDKRWWQEVDLGRQR